MAQNDSRSVSLDEAIHTALTGNPDLKSDSIRKHIISEIKSNWNNWIFCINKTHALQDYLQSLSDLGRIAGLRYESGDIDLYESVSIQNKMAGIVTTLAISENDIRKYKNTVRQLIYSNSDIHPRDTSFKMYEIDKFSAYKDLSIYDSSFNEYRKFVHDLDVENRQIALDNLFFRIQYYRSFGLDYAETIITTAKAKLRAEEIDYLEYADYISEAYQIRIDYLTVLNEYNESAIQLEYYAY